MRLLRLVLLIFPLTKSAAGPPGWETKEGKHCHQGTDRSTGCVKQIGRANDLMTQGKLSQSSELNVCTHLQGEKKPPLHRPSPGSQVFANHRPWPSSAQSHLIHISDSAAQGGGITLTCTPYKDNTALSAGNTLPALAEQHFQTALLLRALPTQTSPEALQGYSFLPSRLPSTCKAHRGSFALLFFTPLPADTWKKQMLAIPA